ncbi:SET domain-containing protein [Irpex rosettiformis]|uniref:SET domain-containing protein n=1 Tax=Irpex rosettiformis TaxID=378272 RepID=A0ACB8UDN1_9APHY|nr:SET domain-containing protein [Irpex rosettiformis]
MTTPTEEELKSALAELRAQNPTLGVPKLHAQLLAGHPEWTVSEKRTRKFLQAGGLVLDPQTTKTTVSGQSSTVLIPASKIIQGLDVAKWSTKIEVKYFNRMKGKGLVAVGKISQGDTIWKEDPFILAPEWEIYELQVLSGACGYCSTPLHNLSNPALTLRCDSPAQTPSCSIRFCNRLCLSRSKKTHPLLCPAQNPASVPLLRFAQANQWQALHALAQCTARLLLSEQRDEKELLDDRNIVNGLAQLGMEERAKGGWLGSSEPDRATWKKAFDLYLQAFKEPLQDGERKKLNKLLKKPTRKALADELFEYSAFLRGLGRMNLNLESHGGLYVLHSHVNHSCAPNVSVRHLDQRSALSKITMVALRDIEPGEELFITYTNPKLPLETRRQHLLEWGFGTCHCPRCQVEEKDPHRAVPEKAVPDDLEAELKAGLGVM